MNTTVQPASAEPRSTPIPTSRVPQSRDASVSTLCELGALVRTRPGLTAPPGVVAAWYERKAALLHRIATETGDTDAALCARAAHLHAMALSRGGAA